MASGLQMYGGGKIPNHIAPNAFVLVLRLTQTSTAAPGLLNAQRKTRSVSNCQMLALSEQDAADSVIKLCISE